MNPVQPLHEGFVHDLFERSRRRRGLTLAMLVIAVAGHAVAGTLAPTEAEHAKVAPPVEVEFLPPEPPPLPPLRYRRRNPRRSSKPRPRALLSSAHRSRRRPGDC